MSLRFLSAASLSLACLCFAFPASAMRAEDVACGHVSTEAGNVPTSLGVFKAQITQIDGRPPPMERHQYRLAAGKHVLVVGERIDRARLNSAQTTQIRKMQRTSPAYLKALILDVQPGTSYRLGTRLVHDKLDTQSIRDNAYWEPVVWDEVAQPCP